VSIDCARERRWGAEASGATASNSDYYGQWYTDTGQIDTIDTYRDDNDLRSDLGGLAFLYVLVNIDTWRR